MPEQITTTNPVGGYVRPGITEVPLRAFSVDLDDPERTIVVTFRGANGFRHEAIWGQADANLNTRLQQLNKGDFSGARDSLKTALAKVTVADGKGPAEGGPATGS